MNMKWTRLFNEFFESEKAGGLILHWIRNQQGWE